MIERDTVICKVAGKRIIVVDSQGAVAGKRPAKPLKAGGTAVRFDPDRAIAIYKTALIP